MLSMWFKYNQVIFKMYTFIRSSHKTNWLFTKYKEKIRGSIKSKPFSVDIGMLLSCLCYYCNYYEKQTYTGAAENKYSKILRKLPGNIRTPWTQDVN